MAIGQIRTNGTSLSTGAGTAAVYGYSPLVIKVAATGGFTATTGGNGVALVEGGYDKAVRAVQQLGSSIWIGAIASGTFVVIVDGPSFNAGAGLTTAGAYGALRDAMAAATGVAVGSVTVTTSTALVGDGTFTFA